MATWLVAIVAVMLMATPLAAQVSSEEVQLPSSDRIQSEVVVQFASGAEADEFATNATDLSVCTSPSAWEVPNGILSDLQLEESASSCLMTIIKLLAAWYDCPECQDGSGVMDCVGCIASTVAEDEHVIACVTSIEAWVRGRSGQS